LVVRIPLIRSFPLIRHSKISAFDLTTYRLPVDLITKPSCKIIGFINFGSKIAYILLVLKVIETKEKYTGVIVAGGKSSRMGSDKGLLLYRGKPLVQYSIDLLKPFCSELLISTQNREYAQFGLPMIADEITDCGPMGGIYSSLKSTNADILFVLACDMPFVTPETVVKLLSCNHEFDCLVPRVNEKLEPLCAIYSRKLFKKIEGRILAGNLALHSLILESDCCFVDFNDRIEDFRNFNTPGEIEQAF
jgi:molybdopterin-guanine dinucleotide biosynthesis protein A